MAEVPIIDNNSSSKPRRFFVPPTRTEWMVIVGIIVLSISILIPSLRRFREKTSFPPCLSNLRQIGQAIQLYALDNAGRFPPDFPTILRTQATLSPDAFICPSTSDKPAKGDSPQQRAAQLLNGHCSYIYVGQHFTVWPDRECIVAFEDPANHGLEGAYVLYADGHVEYMVDVASYISELEQGHNPPRPGQLTTKQQYRDMYQRDWIPKLQSIKSGQWSASLPTTRPATQNIR